MSTYDELLDALDAFREARDARPPDYDPCGDVERRLKKERDEAESRLDVVVGRLVRQHAPVDHGPPYA